MSPLSISEHRQSFWNQCILKFTMLKIQFFQRFYFLMFFTPSSTDQDWRMYDYVVIPNLNIFPSHNERRYADVVSKLFSMHLTDIKWKADVTVVLGQNFRGLIAAHELAKVKYTSCNIQDVRKNIDHFVLLRFYCIPTIIVGFKNWPLGRVWGYFRHIMGNNSPHTVRPSENPKSTSRFCFKWNSMCLYEGNRTLGQKIMRHTIGAKGNNLLQD